MSMQGTYAMRIAFSVSDIAQGLLLFVNTVSRYMYMI